MSGFELRLWRRGMHWDQAQAAEALGVSLRSYKRYEKLSKVTQLVALATFALSVKFSVT